MLPVSIAQLITGAVYQLIYNKYLQQQSTRCYLTTNYNSSQPVSFAQLFTTAVLTGRADQEKKTPPVFS
jgi:hypothetical protein